MLVFATSNLPFLNVSNSSNYHVRRIMVVRSGPNAQATSYHREHLRSKSFPSKINASCRQKRSTSGSPFIFPSAGVTQTRGKRLRLTPAAGSSWITRQLEAQESSRVVTANSFSLFLSPTAYSFFSFASAITQV